MCSPRWRQTRSKPRTVLRCTAPPPHSSQQFWAFFKILLLKSWTEVYKQCCGSESETRSNLSDIKICIFLQKKLYNGPTSCWFHNYFHRKSLKCLKSLDTVISCTLKIVQLLTWPRFRVASGTGSGGCGSILYIEGQDRHRHVANPNTANQVQDKDCYCSWIYYNFIGNTKHEVKYSVSYCTVAVWLQEKKSATT